MDLGLGLDYHSNSNFILMRPIPTTHQQLTAKKNIMSLGQKLAFITIGFAAGYIFRYYQFIDQTIINGISSNINNSLRKNDESIRIPMEQFPEPQWITPTTLSIRTVASTPFARFEIHKVKTESGVIVDDWLWTDERSHVNILVHLKDEDKYLLFYQKKYGLEKPYLAVVGGLFNEGETAIECAKRELLEETGLETDEMIDLGRYRVQVNRGGGILYAYLARNSVKSKSRKNSDDYEKQEVRKFTRTELIKATLNNEVGEAQWVAAVALGLLSEEHREHHGTSHVVPII